MLFLSKKERMLLSPCNGKSIPLSEIPDEAFASGMLGEGFGVCPLDGHILSPADGVIDSVAEGLHAYTLKTDDGLELLLHVGVDTVSLEGAPFAVHVRKGDRVRAGELLSVAELSRIREKGLSDTVAVLVTNPERISGVSFQYGNCAGGKDAPMRYHVSGRN